VSFVYDKKVQFYETDLMGIVHHSNYLRYFEEARVAWAHEKGMLDYQKPETASHLAVLETRCRHLRPCFFGDDLKVNLQIKIEGIRICFQYKIFNTSKNNEACVGLSVHAPLNKELRPMRLSSVWADKVTEKDQWTEIWHSNL
jgi:acyl-CoA thioester hydrolase